MPFPADTIRFNPLIKLTSNSPVTFQNKDLLTSAAQWTKTRIFDSKRTGRYRNGHFTGADAANCREDPVVHNQPIAGPDVTGATKVSISGDILAITYLQYNLTQCWKMRDDVSAMLYLGSLQISEGKVLKVDVLQGWFEDHFLLLVQVSNKHSTYLQFYKSGPEGVSLLYDRVSLPESSDGPGPYYVYQSPFEKHAAIVTSDGLVTIIHCSDGDDPIEFAPISGIEAELGPDNRPLITMHSRWLAFCPKKAPKQGSSFSAKRNSNDVNDSIPSTHTNVELPPPGPLHERLMESLSTAAVASLKSLSDAGKAGLKHYLSRSQVDSSVANNGNHGSIPKNRHEMYGYYAENYYYFDDEKRSKAGSPESLSEQGYGRVFESAGSPPGLKALGNMFFGNPDTAKTVHVVDFLNNVTMGYFVPLHGVSALSLSPHDTALAVVSTKGDSIDTYDLSFLPHKVIFSGRYIRGRSPAKAQNVVWSKLGGLGLSTWDKGSLHWFDKRRSYNATNKIWKFSGWKIDEVKVFNASQRSSLLLLVRQGQVMVVDPTNGKCQSKFDIPMTPLRMSKEPLGSPSPAPSEKSLADPVDPLSEYELETCLPYPYIHNDRRLTISIIAQQNLDKYFEYDDEGGYSTTTFGLDIEGTVVDFGKGDGKTEGITEEDLIDAMEDCRLDFSVENEVNTSNLTSTFDDVDETSTSNGDEKVAVLSMSDVDTSVIADKAVEHRQLSSHTKKKASNASVTSVEPV